MKIALILIVSAVAAYLLGCINGAILSSKFIFREDVREKGSGNAGLTNFYRVYGIKGMALVIAIDVLKTVLGVLLGRYLFGTFFSMPVVGAYWSGFWVILGHSYPCMFKFHGGKGILCAGALLIMLDWRIAVVGFGAFFGGLILSGYVSLGSILAIFSFPLTTFWVYHGEPAFGYIFALGLLAAASTFFSHRGNVKRLLTGQENKFRFHKKEKQQ